MKVFVVALALSVALSAAPVLAQAPAPLQDKPAPPAAQTAQKPVPFQMGLKYGYVQLQEVAQSSNQGKAFNAKVKALEEQKVKELQDKNKVLQAAQEKLEKGSSVLNEQARASLQADIDRQQRDIQRFTEDAQRELQALTQNLQAEFERLLVPIIEKVAKDKQVHFVFDAAQSGLVWADPSMSLTADVIAALDAAASTAKPAPAAPAPKPAAPPATQK